MTFKNSPIQKFGYLKKNNEKENDYLFLCVSNTNEARIGSVVL